MSFPTKDTFTFDFEAQTDYPNWTPAQTKEHMNERGEELRVALNAVVDLLNATTSDASGADNTGIPETIAGSGTNVRDRADWLYAQIVAAVLGAIPDGSIATSKYADGSVTAAKCAADVATQTELDDLAGVGRTTETVKGNADAVATHLAEKATQAQLGHIMVDNETVFADENGIISAKGGLWEKILVDNGTTIVNGMLKLASDTAQIDFESLGIENYKLLRLIVNTKINQTTIRNLRLRYNDIISGSYSSTNMYADKAASAVSFDNHSGETYLEVKDGLPAYYLNNLIIDITNQDTIGSNTFVAATNWKLTTGTQTEIVYGGGSCTVFAPITKISLLSPADSIATGSTFMLLGVK